MHRGFRNYWPYSIGVGVVLMIVLAIVATAEPYDLHTFLLVFAGFAIGWISGTAARYAAAVRGRNGTPSYADPSITAILVIALMRGWTRPMGPTAALPIEPFALARLGIGREGVSGDRVAGRR
jgi:hypothetical protein